MASAADDDVPARNDELESPAAARQIREALRAAAERVAPAVVALDTAAGAPLGTGVVIDPKGIVLTHGHSDAKIGDAVRIRFPSGRMVNGQFQSVHVGRGRDFAVVRITDPGPFPHVPLPDHVSAATADHCFHLGYPNVFGRNVLRTPLLRFGRISGTGRVSVYANCLIMSGDSGGPLFDMDGRLLGVANYSIGPELRHPGQWAAIPQLLDGRTWLQPANPKEVVELGFTNSKRTSVDTTRHVANAAFEALVEPARRATVQILVDGEPVILGTVVGSQGLVLTKRSEVLNSAGQPIGKLTCRTFAPEAFIEQVTVQAQFPLDDVVFLKVSGGDAIPHVAELQTDQPQRGTLVIVPQPGQTESEIGVIGTEQLLRIEREPGVLPLKLEQTAAGIAVVKVSRTGKDRTASSVEIGDLVMHLDGTATPTLEGLEAMVAKETITAGDPLVLTLRRGDETLTRVVHADSPNTAQRIHQFAYAHVSLRRTGFPSVLSHDAIVPRAHCGGPVVDVQGRIVGVNIARIQRVSTLALPASRIRELLAQVPQ